MLEVARHAIVSPNNATSRGNEITRKKEISFVEVAYWYVLCFLCDPHVSVTCIGRLWIFPFR